MDGTTTDWLGWLSPDKEVPFLPWTPSGPGPREDDGGGLRVPPALLRELACEAFRRCAFYLPSGQLDRWAAIRDDEAAPPAERFVADTLIRNAAAAAEGVWPLCQDTGTATVFGFKGDAVRTGGDDARDIAEGIREAWTTLSLRHSQMAALDMCTECNTGNNLPAQIDCRAVPGGAYRFLFVAKGGGSSNKTCLVQATRAVLRPEALEALLRERLADLGVAACPPYHVGVVIGGFSPEYNLTLLKLATSGYLDSLPAAGAADGRPFRDRAWEEKVLILARESGLGAQFGGRHLAASARVVRLPRHAGSCPISLGVSCSAHRTVRARIDAGGVCIERLEEHPERFIRTGEDGGPADAPVIDLEQPMDRLRQTLRLAGRGSLVLLDGPLVLARDMAHARFRELWQSGAALPAYLRRHPVYYAGPAETPPGKVIGSLGPTTAARMDGYVPELMARGASLVMVGKGPRSAAVAEACRTYGGFYLAAVGGAAALQARDHVTAAEVLDYPDLGMEAVRLVRVRRLPALVVLDDGPENVRKSP